MKTTTTSTLLFLASTAYAAAVPALFKRDAAQCQEMQDVQYTFYGFPDNTPPSAQTAFSCGSGNTAGGIGTYTSPLTAAAAPDAFPQCTLLYSPYLKKYLIIADTCAQCTSDYSSSKKIHIDIWTGSSTVSGGQPQKDCENDLTPDAGQMVISNPPQGLSVNAAALFDQSCHKENVFDGATGSCSGGTTATPTPTPSGTASATSSATSTASPSATPYKSPSTIFQPLNSGSGGGSDLKPLTSGGGTSFSDFGCKSPGHCAGDTCSTKSDCDSILICEQGKCVSPIHNTEAEVIY